MYTFAYLGMPQIVIILVIALLIFGPQKVPELARQIGGALRDLKKMSNDVQSAFDLDDHHSYDRYEPPTYEYSPPVSSTYDHGPLDQYGLPEVQEPAAIEALEETESVSVASTEATEDATEAIAAEAPGTETTTTTVLETETTKDVTGADAAAASA
jgi:TatA/E family protein of Tat protein translocase